MVSRMTSFSARPCRKAFTLIEVIIVVALFGIIAAVALAPAVAVVRRFEDVRAEEAREQRMTYFLRRIPDELRASPKEFIEGPAVVLIHRDVLGGAADDRLAFWSDRGGEPGVRAIRLFQPGAGRIGEPGVYRWVLPLLTPNTVNWEMLDPRDGRLLFPGADSLRFSVLAFDAAEWSDEYSGPRPRGIRLTVKAGEEEFVHEDWLPPQ